MMRVSTFYLFLAVSCSTCWNAIYGMTTNPQGCLDSTVVVDPDMDYFPDKVVPAFAHLWSVTYHNTYKILKNHDAKTSYILYQCGTEPPTGMDANLTLAVPLQNGVGLTTTTSLPHLELLGLSNEIRAYLGDPQWITSPCMLDRIASGETINVKYPDDDGAIEGLLAQTGTDLVIFGDYFEGATIIDAPNFVALAAWKERDNHGIAEWHKFYSLFYNKELEANEQFGTMQSRYECTSKNAKHILADKPRPTVIFAEFSTYCGGWSIGSCPNFYCDFIEDCSASMLLDDMSGTVVNPECGMEFKYMTTPEFVAFAKDADVWIYPGTEAYYWENVYQDFGDQLDTMRSVQQRQVYDTVLTATNTWYEHRIVEYDLVLEDFCQVVGAEHALIPHKRAFLRNVFDEPTGDIGECTAELEAEGFNLRSDVCVDLLDALEAQSHAPVTEKYLWVASSGFAAILLSMMALW